MALSASLRASSTSSSQKALDALLDIVVMCVSLRVKYVRALLNVLDLSKPL